MPHPPPKSPPFFTMATSASSTPSQSPSPSLSPSLVSLTFTDVCYEIPSPETLSTRLQSVTGRGTPLPPPTKILHNVSAHVPPGSSLAILGPSGSGKTTLLNLLASRSPHPPSHGQILFAGHPRVARTKRRIGYVMQDDVFFSKLTVRETLQFTADIRLPRSLTRSEREARVTHVVNQLRLSNCLDTRVGDQQFDKGISGGERKRLNIANEILHSPDLLLADESTSGLDSSSALTVVNLLHQLCDDGCTLVATIHQPSSRILSSFDSVLLLAKGHVAYSGPPARIVSYFESLGFPLPSMHYNPADYMLELVMEPSDENDIYVQTPPSVDIENPLLSKLPPSNSFSQIDASIHPTLRTILEAWRTRGTSFITDSVPQSSFSDSKHSSEHLISHPHPSSDLPSSLFSRPLDPPLVPSPPKNSLSRVKRAATKRYYDVTGQHQKMGEPDKYLTNWYVQVAALAGRSFRQKRGLIFHPLYIAHVLGATIVSALVWGGMELREGTIEDRLGALSFFSVFWSFYSTYNALFAFPVEKQVLHKDRAGGSYRLSAYYVAKTFVESPVDMLYPVLFSSAVYFSIGLNPNFVAFLLHCLILIINVLVAQSLGLLLSAITMDVRYAQVSASIVVLSSMLLSGYYIDPNNFSWYSRPFRYASFIKYTYEAMVRTEMLFGRKFTCENDPQDRTIYSNNGSDCPIRLEQVLRGAHLENSLSIGGSILVLISWIVVLRLAGYIALKLIHSSHKPKASSWKR